MKGRDFELKTSCLLADFSSYYRSCILKCDWSDALTSVGSSLVGAVIGNGRLLKGQEGAPLLSPPDQEDIRRMKV